MMAAVERSLGSVPQGMPDWLTPEPWLRAAAHAGKADVARALSSSAPDEHDFAALLSPSAGEVLESLAHRAQSLTRRHFGRTVSLYVPLYLSNYCDGGCAYCGFAADRKQVRSRLPIDAVRLEVAALKQRGFEDVLLLTGERCPDADFEYLLGCVREAAALVHEVSVEAFAMTAGEYGQLAAAGCTGVTLYQETYDPARYAEHHRWGPKRDYASRLDAPSRALSAGIRTAGLGALLGLGDPFHDGIALYRHARHLRRVHWRSGVQVSFPRLRPERGAFHPERPVDDRLFAQMVFALRICLPDVPLVLSTREPAVIRDGLAGVGISRMSVASRTTVGGYAEGHSATGGQFDVNDARDEVAFCSALRGKGLEPVFKHGDAVYRGA
jgi:2-iminoacetate synthase